MPETKLLSKSNLLSKQSMGDCGKGAGRPHLGLFGKTRGSNKGPQTQGGTTINILVLRSGHDSSPVTKTCLSPSLSSFLCLSLFLSLRPDNYLFRFHPDSLGSLLHWETERVRQLRHEQRTRMSVWAFVELKKWKKKEETLLGGCLTCVSN